MKKILYTVLLLCVVTTSFAEPNNTPSSFKIEQTHDLQLIKRKIFASPKDTLVIFDVDLVLITPNDQVFLIAATEDGQKFLANIYDDLFNRLPQHDVDYIQSILMSTKPLRPVTPDTAKIFNQIKSKGYKVIGLTACATGSFGAIRSVEQWRIDELEAIGIVFDKHYIDAKAGALDPYIPGISEHYSKAKHISFPAVKDGIIFTAHVPKGDVLAAYLQLAKLKPKKVIFIDDQLKNLKSVQESCQKAGIEFIGYEYTAIKEQAKNLSLNKKRAKLQYKVLELTKRWVNDQQADELLDALTN